MISPFTHARPPALSLIHSCAYKTSQQVALLDHNLRDSAARLRAMAAEMEQNAIVGALRRPSRSSPPPSLPATRPLPPHKHAEPWQPLDVR